MNKRAIIFVAAIVLVIGVLWIPLSRWAGDPKDHGQKPSVSLEHEHKPGQFGGFIVAIGRDNYHAEMILAKDGTLIVYILGKDETRILPIKTQVIEAYVSKDGEESSVIQLMPKPLDGEKELISRWQTKLPGEYVGQEFRLVFVIMIQEERFRVSVDFKPQGRGSDLGDEAEKKLYLTPAGKYTESDIKANGNMTASQKFKGFVPNHDLYPKKGDRICPITMTKANPKCSWIINGKEYWFCCPPCVEEFVKLAKTEPEKIKDPEEYVK